MNKVHKNGSKAALDPVGAEIDQVRAEGMELVLSSDRKVHVRALEPDMLLVRGDCPDILTTVVMRSLFGGSRDKIFPEPMSVEEAQAQIEQVNLICEMTILDGTPVLSLGWQERQFLAYFVMGGPDRLVNFRRNEEARAMALMAEGDALPALAE